MKIKLHQRMAILAVAVSSLCVAAPAWSEEFSGFHGGSSEAFGNEFDTDLRVFTSPGKGNVKLERKANHAISYLRHWNSMALYATGLDHTPVATGDTRVFGEQLGPTRSSRAMGIIHIAMFDALNAIENKYESYTGLTPVTKHTSKRAAISQAAHDTLVALFPSQASAFNQQLTLDLAQVPDDKEKSRGIELGKLAAANILALRANDQSKIPEPKLGVDFFTNPNPGYWRQDPISQLPVALGAHWSEVQPFVMTSSSQFRLPPPPALNSPEYTAAYNEVKALGGDGVITSTVRTTDQTEAGIFWAYDGMPSLCAPPRLYNQITLTIADLKKTNDALELARLLALVNTAMADAGIASWDSKYFYQFWRPVGGIREGDTDGNDNTILDASFSPLGGQVSNRSASSNFTPPFPAYPSGHATFGGALFQTLRNFYGTDNIPFTFTSDELNGVTKDYHGNVRPLAPRSFSTLSQAEEENGQSRIYLGIHWSFDKTSGISQGRNVANHVWNNAFRPLNHHDDHDGHDD